MLSNLSPRPATSLTAETWPTLLGNGSQPQGARDAFTASLCATRPHVCRFAGRLSGLQAPLLHIWPRRGLSSANCRGQDSRDSTIPEAGPSLHQIWDRPWAHANTTDVTLSRPPRRQGAPYSGSTLKPLGVSAMAQERVAVSRCPGAQRCPSLCPQARTRPIRPLDNGLEEAD